MDGKQLKNSILQWAIQGKLVPQNPKDEPAQKLLERIAAARNEYSAVSACHPERSAKGTKSKDLKKKTSKNPTSRIYRENGVWYEQVGTATPKDITDEIPFEIPETWAWCRLKDVVKQISAGGDKPEKCVKTPTEECNIPIYSNGETNEGLYGYTNVARIFEPSLTVSGRGTIGYTCVRRTPYVPIVRLITIIPTEIVTLEYLQKALSVLIVQAAGIGTSIPQLTVPMLAPQLFPLPPLAEQKRIVAKLEQVLPLAEEYGAAQEQLDKLNKELPEALKKSILQEAIQGKLVPQNPKDEPAQKLLERITVARSESSQPKGAKSKKSTPTSRIYCENGTWYEQIGNAEPKDITGEIPFDIPTSWVWCRLKRVCCDFIVPQRDKPTKFNGCIPWCRIEDIEGKFLNGSKSNQLVTKELADSMNMHLCPKGTVICACSASIGNQAITTVDCYTNQTFIGVVCEKEALYNEYLYYFMMSQKQNLKDLAKGTTIGYISRKKFEEYIFPLPPLAEQKRIVAKLEQLFKVL